MDDHTKNKLKEAKVNKTEYDLSRKIFKSEKVAEEFLTIKKKIDGGEKPSEYLDFLDSMTENPTIATDENEKYVDASVNSDFDESRLDVTTIPSNSEKEFRDDLDNRSAPCFGQPIKRKAGRPKGSKSAKKLKDTDKKHVVLNVNEDLLLSEKSMSFESDHRNINFRTVSHTSAPIYNGAQPELTYLNANMPSPHFNNFITPQANVFEHNDIRSTSLNSIYNTYKKEHFEGFNCKVIGIELIQCVIDFTHINILPEFKRMIKLFNSQVGISIPEKTDFEIFKDMFIMSIENRGFFDPTIHATFLRIFKNDYQTIIDRYIIYVLPFEQYYFGKPNIEIFSRSKKDARKNTLDDNLIERLRFSTLKDKFTIIREMRKDKFDRLIVNEVINIYCELLNLRNKRKVHKGLNGRNKQPHGLKPEEIALFTELCLKIVIEYIQGFDFCDLKVINTIRQIKEGKYPKQDWNYCLSYTQIITLINVIPSAKKVALDLTSGLDLAIFNSFKQYVDIVTTFYFIIDFNKHLYKQIINHANLHNAEGVFAILSKFDTSKNVRRKILRKYKNGIEEILIKYNCLLFNSDTIKNACVLENIIHNLYCFKKYRPLLEKIHKNIIKYNVDQRYNGINRVLYNKLLDVFRFLTAKRIYSRDIDIEMLWSASNLSGYKEVVMDILKNVNKD